MYDTDVCTMIIKLPTAVHEVPFDHLKKVLESALDDTPYDEDTILAQVHMNCDVLVMSSTLVPDMLISLMAVHGSTFTASWYLLIGECAFSKQKSHIVNKLKKYIQGFPNLMVVVMVIIDEVCDYQSPLKNSDTWEFFWNIDKVPSLDEFLALCPNAGKPLSLSAPIKIKGHTWCHINSVDYYIWVRQPVEGPIDLDSTDAEHMAHGVSSTSF